MHEDVGLAPQLGHSQHFYHKAPRQHRNAAKRRWAGREALALQMQHVPEAVHPLGASRWDQTFSSC